jgi:alpha-glucosidase
VGEVGDAQIGLQIVADYTSGNDKMHMCYAFEFLSGTRLSVRIASGGDDGFR